MLNTVVSVTVYNDEDAKYLDGALELCKGYEAMLSRTVEGSDIYKINNSNGQTVTVSEETAQLISKAIYYCKLSGGAFDITTAHISDLWNFSGEAPSVPNDDAIAQALKWVDYTVISVEGCNVTLPKGYAIDLGAIAKGYIADRLVQYFEQNGVQNAIIDLGGNICVVGSKGENGYKIGIRSPFDGQSTMGYVNCSNMSVVTSGTYERCFEQDGRLYHHILDTKTGMPANTGLVSVSIVASHSVDADALSTTCLLLGAEKGIELLEGIDGAEGIFIASDGEILTTTGAAFIQA